MAISIRIAEDISHWDIFENYIDGLVHDCSNSSALAMELLQSCMGPMK